MLRLLQLLFWIAPCGVAVVGLASASGRAETLAEQWREAGRPLLRHYAARDYGAHHQMWAGVEDANGLPHFGNRGCVLDFDGVDWGRIPVGATTFVRGLAVGPDRKIYVGAVDELGYLEVDRAGRKSFVSLRDRLPPEHREFGDIWKTVATKDGVFFAAGRRLLRWHEDAFTVREFSGEASLWLHEAGGRIYLHRRGEALRRYDGGEWVTFCDDPWVRRNRLPVLLQEFDGRLLLGSADEGLARVDATTGALTPFATEAEAWLRREGLQTAALARQLILLASRQDGIVAIDGAGRFVRRFDEADGLRDPQAKHLLVTRNDQVWIALNNGVSRLTLPLNYTTFGREQGLDGTTVRATARHNGRLIAATGRGLFELEPTNAAELRNARFVGVPGFSGRYFSVLDTPRGLLAGENDGLDFLAPGAGAPVRLLAGHAVVLLAKAQRPTGRVWAGTMAGVFALDPAEGGGWRVTAPAAALRFEARSLAEADDGTLWLGTFTRGVARVRGTADMVEPEVIFYRENHGLPAGHGALELMRAGGEIVVSCAAGEVLRYEKAGDRFVPAERIGPKSSRDRLGYVWRVRTGRDGQPDAFVIVTPEGHAGEMAFPEIIATAGPLQSVRQEGSANIIWAAGADGLARLDFNAPYPMTRPPSVALRAALLNGSEAWPANFALPAGDHAIAFRFRSSAFAPAAQFSSRLEGWEKEWTAWSTQRGREFSRLPPGNYVLHVRARNGPAPGDGQPLFAFSIAAPWWWSRWWAAAGAAAAVGLVGGVVRWRVHALRRRAAELEATIAARTRELEASREELMVARDAAEAANRAKSTFLAHMSHELRTPLNGILGYAQVLARDPAQAAPARERLGVIVASGEHLLGLINEVLDLARVEAGKLQLRNSDFSPEQLAGGVADLVRARCEEKQIAFAVRLGPGLPRRVRSDEQKLRQVLLNLLGNAVKFTARGQVTLEVAPAPDGRLRFAVEDTGPGIAAEQVPSLFQPFATSAAQAAGGTGLGLALSRSLVELLGGRLQVASEPGRGARFWFELPLPEVDGVGASEGGGLAPVIGLVGAPPHVLIVDDDARNRGVLRDLLGPLGFSLAEAAEGEAALAAARARTPQAVLLDLRFERGPDGLAIARALRQEPALVGTKIIAVSASVFESDRHQALAAGCDAFLAKPLRDEQLFALLGAQLHLEWLRAAPAVGPAHAGEAVPLPPDTRAQLLEYARRGDARRLRARLAELAADPRYAAEVAPLDAAAARFQMERLRELLSPDAQNNSHH